MKFSDQNSADVAKLLKFEEDHKLSSLYSTKSGHIHAMTSGTDQWTHNFRTLCTPEELSSGERFRQGLPADAKQIIEVLNQAFGGRRKHFWKHRAVAGEDPLNVGIRDVQSNHGYLSWRNVVVVELNGKITGCLFGLNEVQETWKTGDPKLLREENELHAVAYRVHTMTENAQYSHTWYIPFIVVDPQCQRRGLATRLINYAIAEAEANGKKQISLMAGDHSLGAYNLYKNRFGFQEIERVPIVKGGWDMPSDNWICMRKDL